MKLDRNSLLLTLACFIDHSHIWERLLCTLNVWLLHWSAADSLLHDIDSFMEKISNVLISVFSYRTLYILALYCHGLTVWSNLINCCGLPMRDFSNILSIVHINFERWNRIFGENFAYWKLSWCQRDFFLLKEKRFFTILEQDWGINSKLLLKLVFPWKYFKTVIKKI